MRPKREAASFDHARDRVSVGDVGGDREGLAARALDLAGDGLRLLHVRARVDDDRRAAIGQRERDGATDIAPRAGDDRDAA